MKCSDVHKILLMSLSCLFLLLPNKALSQGLSQALASELPEQAVDSDKASDKKLFAIVNGYEIFEDEYLSVLRGQAKKQYYHGNITKERLAQLRIDAKRQLIDSVLLTQEAKRLGLVPDANKVEAELKRFDERNATDPTWLRDRETFLPALRNQFESKELIALIESTTRSDILLTEPLKKQFYADNPELFVFPARKKVSIILMKVSPFELSGEWDRVHDLMDTISARISAGENFADLAREFSEDSTADQGGDMGYQHKGMLHSDVEKVLDELKIGEVSKPIRVLEGYVLVRVEDVIPEQKISYADSEKQLVELLSRKLSDDKWQALLDKLRDSANIVTEF